MRKYLKVAGYIFGAVLLLSVLGFGFALSYENNYLFFATGSDEKAFLNSTWLMSPKEVERSNNTRLKYEDNAFYVLFLPNIVNEGRYLIYKQENVRLWDHYPDVSYYFFDKKLFSYEVYIESYSSKETSKTIIDALSERFGPKKVAPEAAKHYLEAYEWNYDNQTVQYTMHKDSKEKKKHHARINITYLPLYDEIKSISQSETEGYF